MANRQRILGSVLALTGFAVMDCKGAEPKDTPTKHAVTVVGKSVKLLGSQTLDRCPFSRQCRPPITNPVDWVSATKGKTFLLVEIETDFPRGPGLDMSVFLLREKGEKQKVIKPSGFTSGGKPDGRGLRLYRAEEGAAGDFDKAKRLSIMDNPLGKPWQIYFAYMQDAKGKDIHWPGGKATVKLVYEIPKEARHLELVKAAKVRIRPRP